MPGTADKYLCGVNLGFVASLATDEELWDLQGRLLATRPLLKFLANHPDVGPTMEGNDVEGRDDFIEILESCFLFLPADARDTLRGWRQSYHDDLLSVKRKLRVPCSNKLSAEDLKVEIFLHFLDEYSRYMSLE